MRFYPKIFFPFVALTIFSTCGTTTDAKDYAPSVVTTTADAPFSKGVNLSGWFQYTGGPRGVSPNMFTADDFADIKRLGVDVVRLPLDLFAMTSGAPDYTLDPLFLKFLDQAVDYAEESEIYLILDNHSSDGSNGETSDAVDEILIPIWTQMAEHFKDRSDYVVYEVMNEPYGVSSERWGEIQGRVIEAIRAKDERRTIVVGGTSWNSIDELAKLPVYEDDNLIYTFHFYDPFLFTHQGASWASPSLANLKSVPFPANAGTLPNVPPDLKGSWVENSLKYDYTRASARETLTATIDKAVQFSIERGVAVFCGEFGVYMRNSNHADRVRWYELVTKLLDERRIARTSWDYTGGFGLFKTESGRDVADLDVDVVQALDFTLPPQKPTAKIRAPFVLYDDSPSVNVSVTHWGGETFDLYNKDAAEGDFAILWENIPQYGNFSFGFTKPIDWLYLKDNGFVLEFKVKTSARGGFDVRFIDAETDDSVPWRMRFTVSEEQAPADSQWHTIVIPLADMQEHGAWINATEQWRDPEEKFDWEKIDVLQFAAENVGVQESLHIDVIKIAASGG
ncbi:MAG: glycoside hydrolase family 5 protein [Treponema sp.]|jgi:endoglucanase|nr:glycoside hydrolase family 5 protein [Treponema sp.]